jgi:hypothetical protein
MQLAYAEIPRFVEADVQAPAARWTEPPTDLPMLGFLVAAAISVPLWALIAWAAWALLA